MSSTTFSISTAALSQPESGNDSTVDKTISFSSFIAPTLQLSSPSTERSQYSGLLYTPSVNTRCADTQSTIAQNLTLQDLPLMTTLIAFAPSSNCREFFLSQAIADGARALVLYPPSLETTPTIPPSSTLYSAPIPVYFTSWTDASPIASAMNMYNKALADVPNGRNLSTEYPANEYIRLVLSVMKNGSTTKSLPGLWIFLLIVLGVLCLIVAATSIAMHTHQYFARRDLRRRIAAGEVDLEALGIKRLSVPQRFIDALPQRVWLDEKAQSMKQDYANTAAPGLTFDQTSCAICLEDYESSVSTIRELPCHHIYHPACIDSFLLKRSSLCPLCKQSVLPKGYIPPDTLLTSATVMRERRRRRQALQQSRQDSTSGNVELEIQTSTTSAGQPRAALTNLAPDNDDEAASARRSSPLRRLWTTLFPGRV